MTEFRVDFELTFAVALNDERPGVFKEIGMSRAAQGRDPDFDTEGIAPGHEGRTGWLSAIVPGASVRGAETAARDGLQTFLDAHGLAGLVEGRRVLWAGRLGETDVERAASFPADAPRRTLPAADGRTLVAGMTRRERRWFVRLDEEPDRILTSLELSRLLRFLFDDLQGRRLRETTSTLYRGLAARETPEGLRYDCDCCGCFALEKPPLGSFEICPICFWESDFSVVLHPDREGGPNGITLTKARADVAAQGFPLEGQFLRAPHAWELPDAPPPG